MMRSPSSSPCPSPRWPPCPPPPPPSPGSSPDYSSAVSLSSLLSSQMEPSWGEEGQKIVFSVNLIGYNCKSVIVSYCNSVAFESNLLVGCNLLHIQCTHLATSLRVPATTACRLEDGGGRFRWQGKAVLTWEEGGAESVRLGHAANMFRVVFSEILN